jgi:hypothetical protein
MSRVREDWGGIVPPPGFSFINDAFAYSGESTGGRRIQIGDAVVADVKAEIRADFLTCGLDDALRIYGGILASA